MYNNSNEYIRHIIKFGMKDYDNKDILFVY